MSMPSGRGSGDEGSPLHAPDGVIGPERFRAMCTADGTWTLRSDALDEQYHSLHGAAQEGRHVFIEAGMRRAMATPLRVLEVGLGTGLNALLTWIEAERAGRAVLYHALEPLPVPMNALRMLDHPSALAVPACAAGYWEMMTADPGIRIRLSGSFVFERSTGRAQHLACTDAFDLVYFDAFSPAVQPELWTADVFARMFRALCPGGALVTYCAKGGVRRTLQACGFDVERLPGPPGKREMLRAIKPTR